MCGLTIIEQVALVGSAIPDKRMAICTRPPWNAAFATMGVGLTHLFAAFRQCLECLEFDSLKNRQRPRQMAEEKEINVGLSSVSFQCLADGRGKDEDEPEPESKESELDKSEPEGGAITEDVAHESEADDSEPECDSFSEEGFSAEDTILIFDWDDTVLPSTWIQRQGLTVDRNCKLSDWQQDRLAAVAEHAADTLEAAKELGTVVLVTNAQEGWIELSCLTFMPSLIPHLEDVKLMSARSAFESSDLDNPRDWKLCAFNAELEDFFGASAITQQSRRKNVLSFGDGSHEREALLQVTEVLPNCRCKVLKFVDKPDIDQICRQHSLMTRCLDRIVHHDGDLDLCLECP